MANLQGYELTVTGRALLAKAGTGACTLNFTKVKLGADETSLNDLINKTDLVGTNIKQIDIVGSKANEATFTIIATVTNSGMQNNFLIRQVGIFAKGVAATNPGTGVTPEDINETLFAVAYDTQPDIIPAESITPYTRQFNANMTVTNVEQCNVTLTPSGVVTVQVLNNHNDNSEAHGNLIKRIFGSTSATMDSIKNKINDWAKEVCLPLSGGEMTGDITANNVYANNNVLVFNNVEEMKASNKVKTGYTLKTLGFYTAGDGGGADYVITNDIGEDETDEASIIALQNELYAKLLVQDYLNVKQFGAKGDNVTDDTEAIQKVINYQKNSVTLNTDTKCYTGVTVYIPKGVYYITEPLVFYTGAGSIKADSAIFKVKENIIGVKINSLYLDSDNLFVHSQNTYEISGLRLISLGNAESNTGIEFEGDRNIVKSMTSFKNIMIKGFTNSIKCGNGTWNNIFIKCSFFNSNSCVLIPNNLKNAFERWDFYSCVFAESNTAIENHNGNGNVNLINCSIDYIRGNAFYLTNGASVYAINCWIEWRVKDNKNYIGVVKNIEGEEETESRYSTLLNFKNCRFVPMYDDSNNIQENEKYTHGLFYCDINYTFPLVAGIKIQDCYIGVFNAPEILTGGGQITLTGNTGYFWGEHPDKIKEDVYNLENIPFIPYGLCTDLETYSVNLEDGILSITANDKDNILDKAPIFCLPIKTGEFYTLDINVGADKIPSYIIKVRTGFGYFNGQEFIKIYESEYMPYLDTTISSAVEEKTFKNFKMNSDTSNIARYTDKIPFPIMVYFLIDFSGATYNGFTLKFNKIEINRKIV